MTRWLDAAAAAAAAGSGSERRALTQADNEQLRRLSWIVSWVPDKLPVSYVLTGNLPAA